jgi:hypothetical protein
MRKLIWLTPATRVGAGPAYSTSNGKSIWGPEGPKSSMASTPNVRAFAGRGRPISEPSGCEGVMGPSQVAKTLTMEPGAAGLSAEFNEPS